MICPDDKDCDNNRCVKRHPKTGKYFKKNGKCKYKICAYSHVKEGNNLKIEILERKVDALKHEIEVVKKINQEKLENERKANTEPFVNLSNTVADIVERLRLSEGPDRPQRQGDKCG